ncbi:hypothetical protein DF3PB_600018 [uncultured Defluviicoccus sp.]|uniref:Uncharacterized protein n=1 Tax=metagenome TaxID=256318 RepID=A0A380TKN5_9ZZZZ|nr:hypothetical protein DF3PB_600018 [uncultured Defluviicoccus sp.]
MSRWILSKPEYHDDSPIAVAGKLVLNSTVAIKQTISDHAKKVARNDDLSDSGKQKRLAKLAADEIKTFRSAQQRAVNDLHEARTKAQNKRQDAPLKVSFEERKMMAEYLRSITRDERTNLIRQAAAGKIQGSDLIMNAVLELPPFLVGYNDADQILVDAKSEYLARVAPQAVSELADIEQAELDLNLASEELVKFGHEVAGQAFEDALAAMEGRKPWSELTIQEKVEAAEKRGDRSIDDLMKDGVFVGEEALAAHRETADRRQELRDEWAGYTTTQKIDNADFSPYRVEMMEGE